jgi:hypothetical protein
MFEGKKGIILWQNIIHRIATKNGLVKRVKI